MDPFIQNGPKYENFEDNHSTSDILEDPGFITEKIQALREDREGNSSLVQAVKFAYWLSKCF